MCSLNDLIRQQHVIALLEEARKRKTTNLNLSNFRISVIPRNLFRLKHLRKLYINGNKINDLSGIAGLKRLAFLALDYNNVEKLPKEIKHLASHLTRLNVSYNPLLKIPPEIGKLRYLTVLWLNHCQLSELPKELGKLSVLDTFGARGNAITVIPHEFCKLTFLRWLTLEDNLIEELPRNFKELTALKHLNLENNCIKAIPEALTHLMDLKYCFLGKNKIKKVSVEFLKEVRHIVKLDLRGNKDLHVTAEMKMFPVLCFDGCGIKQIFSCETSELVQNLRKLYPNTDEMICRNLWVDECILGFQLPNIATEMLGATSEVMHEEEWEDVSVSSVDEEWVAEEEDSEDDDDDLDWEESLPSSELDLSELSDIEDFEVDDVDRAMALPETIANIIPRISFYIFNGV